MMGSVVYCSPSSAEGNTSLVVELWSYLTVINVYTCVHNCRPNYVVTTKHDAITITRYKSESRRLDEYSSVKVYVGFTIYFFNIGINMSKSRVGA